MVVTHLGVTTKQSIGATTARILKDAPAKVQGLCDAANNVNPDVITLCYGSPVYMPDDAQGINGFYGASSMERLHTEIAIREQMEKFKAIQEFQCS